MARVWSEASGWHGAWETARGGKKREAQKTKMEQEERRMSEKCDSGVGAGGVR